jgi:hypothetical protein
VRRNFRHFQEEALMPKQLTLIIAVLLVVMAGCDARSPAGPAAEVAVGVGPLAPAASLAGLTRTAFPSPEDPGGPFYARTLDRPPFAIVDGGWAAIPFYRDPECLAANRPDFNLLFFFDVPAAWACPMTVHGFSLWAGEPGVGAPHTLITHGAGAVPVWFVPEDVFLGAVADGELTIGELASLPGRLVGLASHFEEVLQPAPLPPELGGGGHPVGKAKLNARGTLEDGRAFRVHVFALHGDSQNVQIQFR